MINQAAVHQPEPQPGQEAVGEIVIADIKERIGAGLKKYGTLLQTFNGRDALWDLYQELIDACMYTRQRLMEDEELRPQIYVEDQFVESFKILAELIHVWAVGKGFWEDGKDRNDGEMIALMHSELSEALEAIRHGNPPDDKIPQFSGVEAEMADVIIRIMDTAHARGWRVAEALIAKMAYNNNRPYKHGKKF